MVLWSLTDRNNRAVGFVKLFSAFNICKGTIFIFNNINKDNAVILNFNRTLIVFKLDTL